MSDEKLMETELDEELKAVLPVDEEQNKQEIAEVAEEILVESSPEPAVEVAVEAKPKRGRKKKAEKEAEQKAEQEAEQEPEKEVKEEVKEEADASEAAKESKSSAQPTMRVSYDMLIQERMNKSNTWQALDNARFHNEILTGRVVTSFIRSNMAFVGVMMANNPDNTILIPFTEMFRDFPIENLHIEGKGNSPKDIAIREANVLRRCNDAVIPFVITDMARQEDEDGNVVEVIVGSRKKALDVIERANYRPNKRTGKPRIEKDTIVEGTVVSVGRRGMRVNVGGVDVRVPLSSATYRYAESLEDVFQSGQTCPCYIRDIAYDENGRVLLKVDVRIGERIKNMDRLKMIPVGAEVIGTITSISADRDHPNSSILFACIDALGLPCVIRNISFNTLGHELRRGDRVRLYITGKTETGLIRANCRGFLGSAQYGTR